MKPKFPTISITKGSFDIVYNDDYLKNSIVLALSKPIHQGKNYVIDSDLNKWTYQLEHPNLKLSLWKKFLANTFYNPIVEVSVTWRKEGSIKIDELKRIINQCIDQDDDILTQFIDGETIKNQLKSANSFDAIKRVLSKFIIEFDAEEVFKEIGNKKTL